MVKINENVDEGVDEFTGQGCGGLSDHYPVMSTSGTTLKK